MATASATPISRRPTMPWMSPSSREARSRCAALRCTALCCAALRCPSGPAGGSLLLPVSVSSVALSAGYSAAACRRGHCSGSTMLPARRPARARVAALEGMASTRAAPLLTLPRPMPPRPRRWQPARQPSAPRRRRLLPHAASQGESLRPSSRAAPSGRWACSALRPRRPPPDG
jgi:hypothetical protein